MENLYPDIQRKHGRKDLPGNFMEERASVSKFCEDYGFTSFFNHFPQGLDTLSGEDRINISGGQQQLIALSTGWETEHRTGFLPGIKPKQFRTLRLVLP
jgi:ABC-type multidrug transport system fused ATPase/permease subunit